MINIQSIHFSYNKKEELFRDFSLHVPEGSIFGLLGPNGSGKTSLMRLILDLMHVQKGSILINGESNLRSNIKLRKSIGALIESPSLYGHLSGRENLELYSNLYHCSKSRTDEVLKMVDLHKAADKKFKRYSLGMKQRLAIASTLLHNPPLIMLDEPMNGLDPQGMHDMRELFIRLNKEEGKTIFISSHILSEIESTCTDIGIIKDGTCLFEGKTSDLQAQMNSKRQFLIKTAMADQAQSLLKEEFDLSVHEHSILIQLDNNHNNSEILNKLISNGIAVEEAYNKSNKLETLFLELTK